MWSKNTVLSPFQWFNHPWLKVVQNFHFCLGSEPRGLTLPYGHPDRKMSIFWRLPLKKYKIIKQSWTQNAFSNVWWILKSDIWGFLKRTLLYFRPWVLLWISSAQQHTLVITPCLTMMTPMTMTIWRCYKLLKHPSPAHDDREEGLMNSHNKTQQQWHITDDQT